MGVSVDVSRRDKVLISILAWVLVIVPFLLFANLLSFSVSSLMWSFALSADVA